VIDAGSDGEERGRRESRALLVSVDESESWHIIPKGWKERRREEKRRLPQRSLEVGGSSVR
jgi:hypothetical protein